MANTSLFPEVLAKGSQGKAVAMLQVFLNGMALHYPDEPQMEVNGLFDGVTQKFVYRLQNLLDVWTAISGAVDAKVFSAIAERYGCADLRTITCEQMMRDNTLYTGPGFEDRPRVWGKGGHQRHRVFPTWLNQGSQGRAVTILQVFLAGAGFGSGMVFNGVYDSLTAAHVRNLQAFLGKEDVDGHFGPKTREFVLNRYGIDFNTLPLRPFRASTQWYPSTTDGSHLFRYHPARRSARDRM